MKITSEKLLEYIKKNRYFATMRNFNYKLGVLISLETERGEIGKAVVMATFLNTINFRKALVRFSGFKDVGEWEKEAEAIFKNDKRKLPKYIILCRVTELYETDEEEIDMSIDTS